MRLAPPCITARVRCSYASSVVADLVDVTRMHTADPKPVFYLAFSRLLSDTPILTRRRWKLHTTFAASDVNQGAG